MLAHEVDKSAIEPILRSRWIEREAQAIYWRWLPRLFRSPQDSGQRDHGIYI